MYTNFRRHLRNLVLPLALLTSMPASACDPVENGCLGCDDDQLPVCLKELVQNICDRVSPPDRCDRRRVYDDAERSILINTGSHMSRIHSLLRHAHKYELR